MYKGVPLKSHQTKNPILKKKPASQQKPSNTGLANRNPTSQQKPRNIDLAVTYFSHTITHFSPLRSLWPTPISVTHNSPQPYLPLPLSTGHREKKKRKKKAPSYRSPSEKMNHCEMLGGGWCLGLKREGRERREYKLWERREKCREKLIKKYIYIFYNTATVQF